MRGLRVLTRRRSLDLASDTGQGWWSIWIATWGGMLVILIAAVAMLAGGATLPETPAEPAGIVVGPKWLHKPTGRDVALVYPAEAKRQNRSGRARIRCQVVQEGRLDGCELVSEDPENAGFGAAALKLAPKFQMTPILKDGRSTEGGSVLIPLTFLTGNEPASVTLSEVARSDPEAPDGRATVRCQVSRTTPKPEFEGCVVLKSRPEMLGPLALKAATQMPLPSGTPSGLIVVIPFVFRAN